QRRPFESGPSLTLPALIGWRCTPGRERIACHVRAPGVHGRTRPGDGDPPAVQSIITPPFHSLPRFRFALAAVLAVTAWALGQQPTRPNPQPALRTPQPDASFIAKLRTPRATLQTLYYAVDVYDYFPALIADAVGCLDLGGA